MQSVRIATEEQSTLSKRDDFSKPTKRILQERASLICCNPDCKRCTAAPSDDSSGNSTLYGKACHIAAASKGGPRYDSDMTPSERKSPNNGIWLCTECAERVDKKQNELRYPPELLKHWKQHHESAMGTDFATKEGKRNYPARKLTIIDYAGVIGELAIDFGALTVFLGTSKLNQSVGEILRTFSDRNKFENINQPHGDSSWEHGQIQFSEKTVVSINVSLNKPRRFEKTGRLMLKLSDDKEYIISVDENTANMSCGDIPLSVYSTAINLISTREYSHKSLLRSPVKKASSENTIQTLSKYFCISEDEIISCFKGSPTDRSVFGYRYDIQNKTDLLIKDCDSDGYYSPYRLSSGELDRVFLDIATKIAKFNAQVKPTVLVVDQSHLYSLDQAGWCHFLEWAEKSKLPYQVIVELNSSPTRGDLSHAMCYKAIGKDMAVTFFELLTWNRFMLEC
jgi:hypothetical protein